nr:uncharacterized protein LOC104095783 [Nicotiana tomentosiformis]
MKVAKLRVLRWMCGHTRRDMIRNEVIQDKVDVAPLYDKMRESRLRWFEHVKRRSSNAPVRRCERLAIVDLRRALPLTFRFCDEPVPGVTPLLRSTCPLLRPLPQSRLAVSTEPISLLQVHTCEQNSADPGTSARGGYQ